MRIATIAAVLLLATASRVHAQDKATMLADWERTKLNLVHYIDAVPDSVLGYRPTPGVRTFAEQMAHIVESNIDVGALAIRNLATSPTLGDSAQYLHHKAALRKYVEDSYDYVITGLRAATPAQLGRVSSMYRQPAAPTWRWLQLAHEHSIWTFGQVIAYLRLNGITPPSYSMPF